MMLDAGRATHTSVIPLVLTTLVMTLVALPLVAYFAVNAGAFSAELENRINEKLPPGIVTFDRLEIDPYTNNLHVYDLLLRGIDGIPMVRADHAELQINWSDLSLTPPVSLLIRKVRITGYEVNLSWNDDGDFNFTEGFGFKSKGLVRPVPKPKPLLIFDGIELQDGTVRLRFPDWGFESHNVVADGRVEISKEGLFIQADLRSIGGHVWSKGLANSESLHRLVNPAPPVVDAGSVPIDHLNIGGFVWDRRSFRAAMVELGLPNTTVAVSPAMDFEPPMVFRYLVSVTAASPMTEIVSNGLIQGEMKLEGLFDQVGTSHRFLLDYFEADRIAVEQLSIDKLRYAAFSQQQGDVLDLVFDVQAKSIQVADLTLTDLAATTVAKAGWSQFEIGQVKDLFGQPPLTAVSELMARRDAHIDIGMTQLDVGSISADTWSTSSLNLRGARATYGDGGKLQFHLSGAAESLHINQQELGTPTIDLRLTIPYPNIELSRLGIAWDGGQAELSGHLRPEIGLLNRKAPYELVSSFTELPVKALPQPLHTTANPPETAWISGNVTVVGDVLKKRSLTLQSSALTLRTPDGTVQPLLPHTDPTTVPAVYLGPLSWTTGTGR